MSKKETFSWTGAFPIQSAPGWAALQSEWAEGERIGGTLVFTVVREILSSAERIEQALAALAVAGRGIPLPPTQLDVQWSNSDIEEKLVAAREAGATPEQINEVRPRLCTY